MSDEKQHSPEEQGFNDSELQDIMQEIESLEKEFSSADSCESGEGGPKDLQQAIDKELEELEGSSSPDEEDDVFNDEDFEEMDGPKEEAEVTPISSHSAHKHGMQLKASGEMDLELCFPVGEQNVEFKVLSQGFSVEFNGMVVHVDEQKGCHISMPGGGEFSLPLGPTKVKKAS